MDLADVWRLLHHFFSFAFVGTLVVAEWNGRAARIAEDWGQRAVLYRVVHLSSRVAGLGSLVLLGVFGHLNSVALGYKMGADDWLRWVTGIWLVAIAVMVFVIVPAAGRLTALSESAAAGSGAPGFDAVRSRWRLGNLAMSVFYLAMLALMVFRWRA